MSANLSICLNIMIISNKQSSACKFAEIFSSTKINEADIWHQHRDDIDIFSYIRWPQGVITAAPKGITDILIVYIEDQDLTTEELEYLKNYVNERRLIPFKYLVSSNLGNFQENDKLENFKNFKILFATCFEKFSSDIKEKLIYQAITLEKSLYDVFNKLDLDRDGAIQSHEILLVAKSLNYDLSDEDAKEIINLLSVRGKIYYDKFKQWWVMGRADFPSFRRLVKWEMFFSKIKYPNLQENKINLNENVKVIEKDTKQREIILNIKPTEIFEENSSISGHLIIGDDYKEVIQDLPSLCNFPTLTSPLNLGLEIYLRNDNDGPMVLKLLEEIKNKLKNIQIWEFIFNNVVQIKFRHASYSVFIDLNTLGDFSDILCSYLRLNFKDCQFGMDFHLNSNLNLTNFGDKTTFNKILDKLSLLKSEIKCKYERYEDNSKVVEIIPYSSEFPAALILNFLLCNPKLNFASEFDKFLLKNTISETIIHLWNKNYKTQSKEEKLEEIWTEVCIEAEKYIKDISDITSGVHSDYYTLLNYLLANKFSIYANSPDLKIFSKMNIITNFDFLNKTEKL